jgi:hypothetical protein
MQSYYVSTPGWTCRVDVESGVIQPSTARYLKAAHGQAWGTWTRWATRQYGETLRIVSLLDRMNERT